MKRACKECGRHIGHSLVCSIGLRESNPIQTDRAKIEAAKERVLKAAEELYKVRLEYRSATTDSAEYQAARSNMDGATSRGLKLRGISASKLPQDAKLRKAVSQRDSNL